MPCPKDLANKVIFYVDDSTYLALKHRSANEDRKVSQHLRHLVKADLASAVRSEKDYEGSYEGLHEI